MEQPKHINRLTPDGTELNLEALYQIAPSCFTEALGDDGKLHHVIDFNKLRLLLGDNAVDDAPEVYDFTWVGKRAALKEAAAPITKTLRPCPEESVNWDTTQNLYIEGDNLEVLKLLQNSYMGKVKMIYIDPPYNTGNDFVYMDSCKLSGEDYNEAILNEEGKRLIKNTYSNGSFHSDWCSMIYSRLLIARSLLANNGVLFISIDDGELDNLRKICNEVFGESNFIADVSVVNNLKGRNDKKYIARANERLLMYVRTLEFEEYGLSLDEKVVADYKEHDAIGQYRLLELRKRGGADTRAERPNMYYPFYVNPNNGSVSLEKDVHHYIEALPIKSDGIDGRWRWGIDTARKNLNYIIGKQVQGKDRYNIYEKDYLENENGQRRIRPKSVMSGASYSTDVATKEYHALMKPLEFDSPKPVAMLRDLIEYANSPENETIVLDFFSGSATTAHAVMQLNAEDGGKRKYIMVQLPEETSEDSEAYKAGYKNICEIGKERIRRAGKKILEEQQKKQAEEGLFAGASTPSTGLGTEGSAADSLDIGFRVFKCEDSNYKEVALAPKDYDQSQLEAFVDNIKDDRTDLDLLFDCMLHWGVELSLPLTTKKVDGCTIHNVNDGDLVACFDGKVTEAVIEAIAQCSPVRVVFRDSSFTEAAQKMNLFELFKQHCDWTDEEVRNNVRVI